MAIGLERHAEILEWFGEDFDPKIFDPEPLKADVAALAKRSTQKTASSLIRVSRGMLTMESGSAAMFIAEENRAVPGKFSASAIVVLTPDVFIAAFATLAAAQSPPALGQRPLTR